MKINGEIYKLDLSDEKVIEYQKQFSHFYDTSQLLQLEAEKEDITPEERTAFMDKSKKLVTETMDLLLGHGSFEKLYRQSGKSLLNMIDLVTFLTDVIKEKTVTLQDENVSKYLKKKKK